MSGTMKAWIFECRAEVLAPEEELSMDNQTIDLTFTSGTTVISLQKTLIPAEFALVPAANGREPVDAMNPKRVIKTKKPKAAKKPAGGGVIKTSHAVVRRNDQLTASCKGCGEDIPERAKLVLANVYSNTGAWLRLERWHPTCYEAAGAPHGAATGDVEHEHNPSRPGPYGRSRRKKAETAPIIRVLEGVEHGKQSTYARGCRCVPCREEHAAAMKDYYQRRKAKEAANA